jgi:hypothetical protein
LYGKLDPYVAEILLLLAIIISTDIPLKALLRDWLGRFLMTRCRIRQCAWRPFS